MNIPRNTHQTITIIMVMNMIDSGYITQLLADKQVADERVKTALKFREYYSESIVGNEDSGLFDERIVCIVKKSSTTSHLLEYIEQLKAANKALLEAAPQYFNSGSALFREPIVIHDVRKVKITVNTAAGSQKILGGRLAARLDTYIRRKQKEIDHGNLTRREVKQAEIDIIDAEDQRDFFLENPERVYRRRGAPSNDILAIYSTIRDSGGENTTTLKTKVHVNAGGLVLIRNKRCLDSDITFSRTSDNPNARSIYDELEPIPCILYGKSKLYDEESLEKIREARKQLRSNNEEKPRGQFEGYQN